MNKEQVEEQIAQIEEKLAHPEELGTKTAVYTRITGYYRNESAFNPGKLNEYKDRKSFKI